MVNVAGSFVFSVVSSYGLYRAWSWASVDDSSLEMSTIHIIWCIYYNVYIVLMLWAGSTMRNEVMNVFTFCRKLKKKSKTFSL